jgi:hypothetical protein
MYWRTDRGRSRHFFSLGNARLHLKGISALRQCKKVYETPFPTLTLGITSFQVPLHSPICSLSLLFSTNKIFPTSAKKKKSFSLTCLNQCVASNFLVLETIRGSKYLFLQNMFFCVLYLSIIRWPIISSFMGTKLCLLNIFHPREINKNCKLEITEK